MTSTVTRFHRRQARKQTVKNKVPKNQWYKLHLTWMKRYSVQIVLWLAFPWQQLLRVQKLRELLCMNIWLFSPGKRYFFVCSTYLFLWSVIPKKLTILLFWAHLKPVKADSFLATPPLRQEGAAAGNIPAFVSSHKVCYYGTRKKMNLVSTVRKKKIATFDPGANLIQAQTG